MLWSAFWCWAGFEAPRFDDDCEEPAPAPAPAAVPVSAVLAVFAFFLEGAMAGVGVNCWRERARDGVGGTKREAVWV